MKKILTGFVLTALLTGCNLFDNSKTSNQTEKQKGEVYESRSETSITTTVDSELEIINQAGTANNSSL